MPGTAFITVNSMRDIVEPEVRSWRLDATMFMAFGGLALVLAALFAGRWLGPLLFDESPRDPVA